MIWCLCFGAFLAVFFSNGAFGGGGGGGRGGDLVGGVIRSASPGAKMEKRGTMQAMRLLAQSCA